MLSKHVFYLFVGALGVQSAFDRFEGEPCEIDGAVGKCVHISKCLTAFLDLQKRKHPMICSFKNREPVVCCTDCELVNDTSKVIIANNGTVFFKTGQKAKDKCMENLIHLSSTCYENGMVSVWDNNKGCQEYKRKGFRAIPSVFNGRNAQKFDYPHTALLGYGYDRDSAQWHCGGSLISENFVLTAAHCISDSALGPVSFVALGILKRSDTDDLWHIYNVKRIIRHPEYRSPSKYHDIALLETTQRVKYNADVLPACLDVQGYIDISEKINEHKGLSEIDQVLLWFKINSVVEDQSKATAIGWGRLGKNKPLADNLQQVTLQKFSDDKCLKLFPRHRLLLDGYSAASQMCYGDENVPRDTCEGDSGGPLLVKSVISNCLQIVIGVTSYGKTCGQLGEAGMYTRVYHYVPWIESIVWPEAY